MTDDELDQRLRAGILSEPVDSSHVEAAVRARISGPVGSDGRHVPGWAVAAAALVAMVLSALFSYKTFVKEQTPQICVAAAQDHQREIVEGAPRTWLTDAGAMQSLATKEAVPLTALAALATTGYRLQRARLCFLNKQIFLHLVYSKDGRKYSAYLRGRSDEAGFDPVVRGTNRLAYFTKDHVAAVFVGDASGSDANAFARAARKVL